MFCSGRHKNKRKGRKRMKEQGSKPIIIDLSTVNKVKYEQPLYEIEQCFFEEEYRRADQLLYDIVCSNRGSNGSGATKDERVLIPCQTEKTSWIRSGATEDEPVPNVISFLGSRGRGKTSVMMSFFLSLNELKSERNTWTAL